MVHISASNLVKEYSNNEKNPIEANRLREVLQNANMVGDDIINRIMKERLSKVDCRSMGFCLEGYPRTEAQNNYMKNVL
jgi:adenylate kinase